MSDSELYCEKLRARTQILFHQFIAKIYRIILLTADRTSILNLLRSKEEKVFKLFAQKEHARKEISFNEIMVRFYRARLLILEQILFPESKLKDHKEKMTKLDQDYEEWRAAMKNRKENSHTNIPSPQVESGNC